MREENKMDYNYDEMFVSYPGSRNGYLEIYGEKGRIMFPSGVGHKYILQVHRLSGVVEAAASLGESSGYFICAPALDQYFSDIETYRYFGLNHPSSVDEC